MRGISCTGCGLPIFYIAVGAMKKSRHVFNYYKNKELCCDVVFEVRIIIFMHQTEAPKWCFRLPVGAGVYH
jgi:hypothetical protein